MNLLLCDLANALIYVVYIYTILLFVYAVLSWVPDLRRGRWAYYLASIIEPVLIPIRRIIPPLGGFDLAFLILLLVLQMLVRPALAHLALTACYPLF
ncbi:MAG: YggT family protein [Candidatus Eremiobacteraeota bacterium]|nr:YggT family protein [Candidatus Eremiobacteraeota bacterium]